MAVIDFFLSEMAQRGAQNLVLESNQPARFIQGEGAEFVGEVSLDDAQLQDALREVVPSALAWLLDQDGQVNFPYAAPSGTVSILVERRGSVTRASVSPAAYASSNTGGLPPSRLKPPPPDEPVRLDGEASPAHFAPLPTRAVALADERPSVNFLHALMLACFFIALSNIVTRFLGEGTALLMVLASSVAVFLDANRIGARPGKLKGAANMGPWGWFFACLLLWGIGMPYYVLARPLLLKIKAAEDARRPPSA